MSRRGWTPILNSTKIQSISSSSNRSGDPTIMALIQFTRNHTDHSTDKGYQFEFFCDRCGNGFMSEFQASAVGLAASALRAAGGFFGGILGSASSNAYEIERVIQGPAHDSAFRSAVEQAKPNF